jgi:hypothetical protein
MLNPEVTPYLEMICLRCSSKNPWNRYIRAYNVLLALRFFPDDPHGLRGDSRRARRYKAT